MLHSTLINATDIAQWANRRDSQSLFPKLLRRLIRYSTTNLKRLRFPSEEGVSLAGWDGIVEVEEGNEFIPEGISVWEAGTNRQVKPKADDDYLKRTADPGDINPNEATYVFVTPRRWSSKDEWVKNRRAENIWANVIVYDADDIEAALENAPAIHIWASILLGRRPQGAIDIANYWEEWTNVTSPKTASALVIAGRNEEKDCIINWLQESPSCLSFQAETPDEAVAFLAASLIGEDHVTTNSLIERTVIIEDEAAWRLLTLSQDPLVLIPTFTNRQLATSAIQNGHHVLLPMGKNEPTNAASVTLIRSQRDDIYAALKEMIGDTSPRHNIANLATLGRRSTSALRRQLAVDPSVIMPNWASPTEARALLAAILIGSWDDSNTTDREIITNLAQCSYDQIVSTLLRWANDTHPFARHVGNIWYVISREDSWSLLAHYLTADDVIRFKETAHLVLTFSDPKFELDVSQRRFASLFGKQIPHSNHLRTGMAETITLMATYSGTVTFTGQGTGQEWANSICHQLFQSLITWEDWASIDHQLPLLAEAAPDEFIDNIDQIIGGQEPIARQLLGQEDSIWSGPAHTGLLWALELLAWSPDYFDRTALQIAALANLDPGGTWGNRPINSLYELFLPWHPSTNASVHQREIVLNNIRNRYPDVAWPLMLRILPSGHQSAHSTYKPKWRDWDAETRPQVTLNELQTEASTIVSFLLDDVGNDSQRWKSLVALLDDVQDSDFIAITDKLESLIAEDHINNSQPDQLYESLRNDLRELLDRHSSFPNANWVMSREKLQRLQDLYEKLEPQDPVVRYAWMFSHSAHFQIIEEDFEQRIQEITTLRISAINEIYNIEGLPGIFRLSQQVTHASLIGSALGRTNLLEEAEPDFLTKILNDTGANCALGQSYISTRANNDAQYQNVLLTDNIFTNGSNNFKANALLSFPANEIIWSIVEVENDEVQHLYWS